MDEAPKHSHKRIPWAEIKRVHVQGEERDGRREYPTQRDLAERYGIHLSTIGMRAKTEQRLTEREILANKLRTACEQKTIDTISDEGAALDLTAFRIAQKGLALVESRLAEPDSISNNAADKLSSAARAYHQLGKLALGESTDKSEVVGDGSRDKLLGEIDRIAARYRREALLSLTDREAAQILYDWAFWARPEQLSPPGEWRVWLYLAGRGAGKTRSGAEWVRHQVESGQAWRIALVAPTSADARDVMVEGESGLLAISPPWNRPLYEPSKRRVTWPSGAIATLYSAEEPDRLRGPRHDAAWADELAAWRCPEAWDMLLLGLRLGSDPRVCATTTPKPTALIRSLLAKPTTHVTRGSTYDNRANLAPAFFYSIVGQYEGTRLGRQELYAELLEDVEGTLWSRDLIDRYRVQTPPELRRIVIAIDPAASAGADSDEHGIIAAGLGVDGHGYILEDLSLCGTPDMWARKAIEA